MTPTILDRAIIIAARAHSGQRRKYTNDPYICHPLDVVQILTQHGHTDPVMLAAAAMHDVLEDTAVTAEDLRKWYGVPDEVVDLVEELTEPQVEGNRATRKAAEAIRLSTVSAEAQTIKCADMISNTQSIVKYDPGFARVYLQEKLDVLKRMKAAEYTIRSNAMLLCNRAADSIGLELNWE